MTTTYPTDDDSTEDYYELLDWQLHHALPGTGSAGGHRTGSPSGRCTWCGAPIDEPIRFEPHDYPVCELGDLDVHDRWLTQTQRRYVEADRLAIEASDPIEGPSYDWFHDAAC